jgi:hypothetical protein
VAGINSAPDKMAAPSRKSFNAFMRFKPSTSPMPCKTGIVKAGFAAAIFAIEFVSAPQPSI